VFRFPYARIYVFPVSEIVPTRTPDLYAGEVYLELWDAEPFGGKCPNGNYLSGPPEALTGNSTVLYSETFVIHDDNNVNMYGLGFGANGTVVFGEAPRNPRNETEPHVVLYEETLGTVGWEYFVRQRPHLSCNGYNWTYVGYACEFDQIDIFDWGCAEFNDFDKLAARCLEYDGQPEAERQVAYFDIDYLICPNTTIHVRLLCIVCSDTSADDADLHARHDLRPRVPSAAPWHYPGVRLQLRRLLRSCPRHRLRRSPSPGPQGPPLMTNSVSLFCTTTLVVVGLVAILLTYSPRGSPLTTTQKKHGRLCYLRYRSAMAQVPPSS